MSIDLKKIESLLKQPLVNSSCIGCWACVAIAKDVFEINDDGYSVVKSLKSYEWKNVEDAVSACPVDAISYK